MLLLVMSRVTERDQWVAQLDGFGYAVTEASDCDTALAAVVDAQPVLAIIGMIGPVEARVRLAQRLGRLASPASALVLLEAGEYVPELDEASLLDIDFLVLPVEEPLLAYRLRRAVAVAERRRERAPAADSVTDESRALTDALREIGQSLSSTLDPQKLMALILEQVQRVVPHDSATIMQLEGGYARVTHLRGYPDDMAQSIAQLVFPVDQPTIRDLIMSGKPTVVPDVFNDPRWIRLDELAWIRSYCGMPLTVQGEVIGILNLDSRTPNAFTPDLVDRLQAFAIQSSIAVENARLYDALSRDTAELNLLQRATAFLFSNQLFTQHSLEDVAMHIARTVVEEFGQIDCGVMLLDETGTQLRRLARTGAYDVQPKRPLYLNGAGLVPAAVRSGEVIYAPDVRGDSRYIANVDSTCSELVLPLRTSQGVIGALDLQSAELDAFSEQNRRILKSFAEQASVAIENLLLYDEVRRYSVDLEDRVNERTAELNRIKERVEAILNNSSDAIVLARADGSIQQTNRAFDRLFHYEFDGAFGKHLSVLARLDYAGALEDVLRQVVTENRPVRVELMAVTTRGAFFDADVVVSPVQRHDEQVVSVVCSIRDITARKRSEKELRRTLERERELSDMKSRFISTASHEFRTPLAMIMTASELLLNYGERMSSAEKRERLEKIQFEVQNITALLDDLFTISRAAQTGVLEFNPTQIDFPDTCLTLLREIQTGVGAGHKFDISVSGEVRTALLDSRLLRRILTNLLSNAVKYSPKGSTIRFDLLCGDAKVIRIQDEGIGIPEADRKHLFEAFHRGGNVGHTPGTGLGLAIVKHAVDLHSGSIHVDTGENAGTTFTLTFPADMPKEGVYEKDPGD